MFYFVLLNISHFTFLRLFLCFFGVVVGFFFGGGATGRIASDPQWSTADAEIKTPPNGMELRAIKGSLFLSPE